VTPPDCAARRAGIAITRRRAHALRIYWRTMSGGDLPARNSLRLSAVVSRMRLRASRLNQAMCGVNSTSSRWQIRVTVLSHGLLSFEKQIRAGKTGDDGKELMPSFSKLGDEKIKLLATYIRIADCIAIVP
jgi:hypothetical protein